MIDKNKLHLFFDTETAGFITKSLPYDDPKQSWCVQIGAILSTADEIISELDVLIKPNGREIPEFLTKNVHRISTEQAQKEGIEELEALEKFAAMCKDHPIQICHNYDFDSAFIYQMFQRQMDNLTDEARSIFFIDLPHFCTMKDKAIVNFCGLRNKANRPKWPKLEELYEILFNENFPNAHNALADARATHRCFYELIKREIIIF